MSSSGNSGGGAAAELSRKAQEAAAAAMSHPLVTNIREQIANINNGDGRGGSGGGVQGFAFLDNMCGPVMDKFRNGGEDDDYSVGRRRGGCRRDGGGGGRDYLAVVGPAASPSVQGGWHRLLRGRWVPCEPGRVRQRRRRRLQYPRR